jgi:hypothetical protein
MVFRDNLGTIIHDVVCNNAATGQLLSLTWPMEFLFIPDWQFNQAIEYRCRFHIQTRGMGSTGTVPN